MGNKNKNKTRVFFYVTSGHGASLIQIKKALKKYKNINIEKFNKNKLERKFINKCTKIGIDAWTIEAKIVEKRTEKSVDISIYPKLGKIAISVDNMIYIKKRVIDNHSMITHVEEDEIPGENEFEHEGITYKFEVFEEEPKRKEENKKQ